MNLIATINYKQIVSTQGRGLHAAILRLYSNL